MIKKSLEIFNETEDYYVPHTDNQLLTDLCTLYEYTR